MTPDLELVARIEIPAGAREVTELFTMGSKELGVFSQTPMTIRLVATRRQRKEALVIFATDNEYNWSHLQGVLWRTRAGGFYGSLRVGSFLSMASATPRATDDGLVVFISATTGDASDVFGEFEGMMRLSPRPLKFIEKKEWDHGE